MTPTFTGLACAKAGNGNMLATAALAPAANTSRLVERMCLLMTDPLWMSWTGSNGYV